MTDTVSPATHYELRRFYADQLEARDRGGTEEWLAVFEDDATMTTKVLGRDSPVRKSEFAAEVRALDATFRERKVQRRHCVHGFTFSVRDGVVEARFYALFLVVDAASGTRLQSAAMICDRLRRHGDAWRVLSRVIERDDLGRLRAGPASPG